MKIPKITSEQIKRMAAQLWQRSAFRAVVWWTAAILAGILFSIVLTFTARAEFNGTDNTDLTMFYEQGAPALTCPEPVFENRTDEKKTDNDQAAMDTAATRCSKIFPRSPCLITFTKVAPQTYRAICGAKR